MKWCSKRYAERSHALPAKATVQVLEQLTGTEPIEAPCDVPLPVYELC
jgi:hypothetical protein